MARIQRWLTALGRLMGGNPYSVSDGVRTPEGNGTVVAVDRDTVKVLINCRRERWYEARHVEYLDYGRAA